MEPNYLILLNYCVGEIVKIKLTEEEKILSETYDDFEEFIREHIEEKYQVNLAMVPPFMLVRSVAGMMNSEVHPSVST